MKSIQEILDRLPQRYPFLLVDRILEHSDTHVVAVKNLTINELFFQGHFPGNPVMPGVFILDALAQASVFLGEGNKTEAADMFLVSIDKARFKTPVVPGDQLILKVFVIAKNSQVLKLRGQGYVDDHLVMESEFTTVWKKH